MAMVHLRVVCPQDRAGEVVDLLLDRPGVRAITRRPVGMSAPLDDVVEADLAREVADDVLTALRDKDIDHDALIALDAIDTAIGHRARDAENEAPGEGDDALVWDELAARTGSDSTLSGTFLAFMVLATLLAAIGVVTDSTVTVVGAMVVGPEFGPLAGVAVGLVQQRWGFVRRGAVALLVGFAVAIVVTSLLTLVARATGLATPSDLVGSRETEFIYHPGWFSLITALIAGAAGMLSLTSAKSAALVGVFISVTTIPAAGNAAVAGVLGQWDETAQSLAQLGINLVGIVLAGTATLLIRSRLIRTRRPAPARAA